MRKIIYKIFVVSGILASAFGSFAQPANAVVNPVSLDTKITQKEQGDNGKLYFTDAIKGVGDMQLYAAHYSHVSHSSHSSHSSHYSHVSSRY